VPKEVYPTLYDAFIYFFKQAGIKNVSLDKEVNFEKLYQDKIKS